MKVLKESDGYFVVLRGGENRSEGQELRLTVRRCRQVFEMRGSMVLVLL